jgi:AbrB family looped-hinge helix DNA binding protein
LPDYGYLEFMEVIKLGKTGQVSIPKAILNRLGLDGETMLLVETTADGGILLRPAGVYPIEIYTDERIEEFQIADRLTDEEAKQLQRQLQDAE